MDCKLILKMYLYLFLLVSFSFSQGTAVSFMLRDVSAKSNGLAGSYTGIASDASAIFYNPAGLSQISTTSLVYDYYKYYPDYSDTYSRFLAASYSVPNFGSIGIGFNYIFLWENIRTDEMGNILGKYKSKEWALTIGYSRKLAKNYSIGGSVKLIKSDLTSVSIGDEPVENNTGYAFDFGILFNNIFPGLCYSNNFTSFNHEKYLKRRFSTGPSIGISIKNIGPSMKYIGGDQEPLPQQIRLGLSWVLVDTDILRFLLSSDTRKLLVKKYKDGTFDSFYKAWFSSWEKFSFNKLDFSIGGELSLFYFCSLRAGRLMLNKKYNGLNYWYYGLSIGPETLRVDFYKEKRDDSEEGSDVWRMGLTFVY